MAAGDSLPLRFVGALPSAPAAPLGVMRLLVPFERWLFLLVCLLTQGCVGVFIPRAGSRTVENPGVGGYASVAMIYQLSGTNQSPSASWLKAHWGKPTTIQAADGQGQGEQWTYRLYPIWCGVVPALIVPVPLILPVTSEKVTFNIREGQIAEAKVLELHFSGLGVYVDPEGRSHSIAGW